MKSKDNPLPSEEAFQHKCKLAILQPERGKFEALMLNEFSIIQSDERLVRIYKVKIPRSYLDTIGIDRFTNFVIRAFKLMRRPISPDPLSTMRRLRKKLRRMKIILAQFYSSHQTICWFMRNITELLKEMRMSAKCNWLRSNKEGRRIAADDAILFSSILD